MGGYRSETLTLPGSWGEAEKDFIEEVTFEVNALLFVIFHVFVCNLT